MAKAVAGRLSIPAYNRLLKRIYPKKEAHNNGDRDLSTQYRTTGYDKRYYIPTDNIILIDDVTISGSQLKSLAKILRGVNYQGNIYGIVLGKTV